MAIYTDSIQEIIQRDFPDVDITDISLLTDCAKKTIFKNIPLDMIDTKYRDFFIPAFTLHYFQYEIGFDTLALWKIKLIEKLYNNKDYINQIYDMVEKGVFKEYRVHKSDINKNDVKKTGTDRTYNSNRTGTMRYTNNISSDTIDIRNGTNSQNITKNDLKNINNNKTSTSELNENVFETQKGTDKFTSELNTTDTINDNTTVEETKNTHVSGNNGNNGTNTSTKNGTVTNNGNTNLEDTKNIDGTNTTDNTDKVIVNGTDTVTNTPGAKMKTSTNTSRTPNITRSETQSGEDMTSVVDMFSDTPQNGLENVRNGSYLSQARVTETTHTPRNISKNSSENGTENITTDETTELLEGTNNTETIKNDTTNRTGNKKEILKNKETQTSNTTTNNETTTNDTVKDVFTNTEVKDETIEDTRNLTNTNTKNNVSRTDDTQNKDITRENTSANTTSGLNVDSEKGLIENKENQNMIENIGLSKKANRNDTYQKDEQHEDLIQNVENTNIKSSGDSITKSIEESFIYSYNMLMKSESFMVKLWSIFDDLFMVITNSYGYEDFY